MPEGTSPPLPIVAFTHEFYPKKAGVSVFIQAIAQAAVDLGHPVEVWARGDAALRDARLPYTVRSISDTLPQCRRLRLLTAARLLATAPRLRRAILYLPETRALRAMMQVQALGLVRPARLVLTLHGSEIHYFHENEPWRRRFHRLAATADRITVLSAYCHDLLVERFPAAAGKTLVTPGAPRPAFVAGDEPRGAAGERVVLLTVARIHPRKGQLEALEAMGRLDAGLRERIVYRVVGPTVDAAYAARLEECAARRGVRLELRGEVDDEALPGEYRGADVFVMTSVRYRHSVEGFGLSYQEAAASGLPIVAHRTGGVSDALLEGETGLLADPDDGAALTEALRRLVADAPLRARMGAAGRRFARRFSWHEAARRTFGAALV